MAIEMIMGTLTAGHGERRGRFLAYAGRRARLALWMTALALLFAPGCVQRRLMIRSDPPGAMVYVDDYQIGATPIATNFTYYGTRKIRLVKDGYQTLTVYERIDPPWYQVPPFDFFSENVAAGEIRDMRVLDYRLVPQVVSPPQNLLDRAEELRARSETPLPPSVLPVN
ncbi:MAG: PEGA domain-containing protein [Thermogutta sp.]